MLGHKSRFGTRWTHFSYDTQSLIIQKIRDEEDDVAQRAWHAEAYNLTPEQGKAIAAVRLPQGYGRFGLTATTKLIAALEAEVITYDKAVAKAGLGHHSDRRTGEIHAELP